MTSKIFWPHTVTKSCKPHFLEKFQYLKGEAGCSGGVLPGLGARSSKLRSKFPQMHCLTLGKKFPRTSVSSMETWEEMVRIRNFKTHLAALLCWNWTLPPAEIPWLWQGAMPGDPTQASSSNSLVVDLEAHLQGHREELKNTDFYSLLNHLAT